MAKASKLRSGGCRRFSTTAGQEELIAREARRTGESTQAVFRRVVESGFEVRFEDAPGGRPKARGCETKPPARSAGLSILAVNVWANYAMFNMLRRILAALGGNADAPDASLAMAAYMSRTDCSVPLRIWGDVGESLASGATYYEAVESACSKHGVTMAEFAGTGAGETEKSNPT
ncbi:MAG: hypothetical protein IJ087_08580 [Eggerthellaceae bacterium]|nr:hypothetical protein [Eggerthellaceae bacterium]